MEATERISHADLPSGPRSGSLGVARIGDAERSLGRPGELRDRAPRVTPPAPPPERAPRERGIDGGELGARLPIVLIASVGAHALLGAVLALLPAVSSLAAPSEATFEVFLEETAPVVAPEPIAPEPEPAAEPEPEPVIARRERAAPVPTPAAPVPTPPATSALPSIDEVFGEPPPPAPAMTGGEGGFAVAEGSADGAAGGVAGGRGHAVGASAPVPQAAPAPAGPSADEIRRARRAYAERIRELLGRAARYPVPARRGGIEGRVVVALRIAADGRLMAARVTSSCGYSMLDEAALAAAHDLSRVPAPPSLVPWDAADELRIPIVFEITR